jgi:hypothetical protein
MKIDLGSDPTPPTIKVYNEGGLIIAVDGGLRLEDNCGLYFESNGSTEFTMKGYYNYGDSKDSLAILPYTDVGDYMFLGDSTALFLGTYIWSKETKIRSSANSALGHGLQITDTLFIYENKPYSNGFVYDVDAAYTDTLDAGIDYGIFYVFGSLYSQRTGAWLGNDTYPWGVVYTESLDVDSGTIDLGCHLAPNEDGTKNLGSSDNAFNILYVQSILNPNGNLVFSDHVEITDRITITDDAVVIELVDTGPDPDKKWFVVNDSDYLSIREDTLSGDDIMFKFQTGGDLWANGDVSGDTLTDRSASIEFEEKDNVWDMAQSMKTAFDNHDITRLDKKLQAKTRDKLGKEAVGKRPSDLIQVLTECILDINERLKLLEGKQCK